MTTRDAIPGAASQLVSDRPVRWSTLNAGDYDGRERTLEIFDVDSSDQAGCLRTLRPFRSQWSEAAGGPIVVLFHTRRESRRLHYDFVASWYRSRPARIAARVAEWMQEEIGQEPRLDPSDIPRFEIDEAA